MSAALRPRFITRHLYLPITEEDVIAAADDWRSLLHLDEYGRASGAVLSFLAGQSEVDMGSAEKMLVDLAGTLRGKDDSNVLELFDSLAKLSPKSVDEAKERGIYFLSAEDIRRKVHLVAGCWNGALATEYRQPTSNYEVRGHHFVATTDQVRTLSTLVDEPDEPIHLHGLAGTGKTFLISQIQELLPGRFAYLAPRARQHAGRPPKHQVSGAAPLTLDTLAAEMLREYRRDTGRHLGRHRSVYVTPEEIAAHLRIGALQDLSAPAVVRTCISAIRSFCWTDDDAIGEQHFSRLLSYGFLERAVIREYAIRLWRFMVEQPDADFRIPLREYHVAKFLDMERRDVPKCFGALLVDEMHDVSLPWQRILTRNPAGFITLGDRYQHLGASSKDPALGRRRTLEKSVRVGHNASTMVNKILSFHPSYPDCQFSGSQAHTTRVLRYPTAALPPMKEGLFLFAEPWSLIEFFQRCAHSAHAGAFRLLESSRDELRRMVGALALLHRGERPTYWPLQQFGTWDAFCRFHQANKEVMRVAHMFDKGYSLPKFEEAVARESVTPCNRTLALLVDGKNLQADVVILAPDLFQNRGQKRNAETVASVYIAVTRARYELWMPEAGAHWLEERSACGPLR